MRTFSVTDVSDAVDTAPPSSTQPIDHKIIRNGQIEFEVDSFDSATLTITKIVVEEHGYVATTNSEKLPNGKVKGRFRSTGIVPKCADKLKAAGIMLTSNLLDYAQEG